MKPKDAAITTRLKTTAEAAGSANLWKLLRMAKAMPESPRNRTQGKMMRLSWTAKSQRPTEAPAKIVKAATSCFEKTVQRSVRAARTTARSQKARWAKRQVVEGDSPRR